MINKTHNEVLSSRQIIAINRICREFGFENPNELRRMIIDNFDKGILSTQWPDNEQDMYEQIKRYICGV